MEEYWSWALPEEIAQKAKELGFPQDGETLPTFEQLQHWLDDNGLYLHVVPEFYTTGINWNWQVYWYLPKSEWGPHDITGGTGLYGDNGEYPTRFNAMLNAFKKAFELFNVERYIP